MKKKFIFGIVIFAFFVISFLYTYSTTSLQIVCKSGEKGKLLIYYDNLSGKGEYECYDEQHVGILNIQDTDDASKESIRIPADSIGHLRLDLDGFHSIEIYEINVTLLEMKFQSLDGRLLKDQISAGVNVVLEKTGDGTRITTDDQQGELPLVILSYFDPSGIRVLAVLLGGAIAVMAGGLLLVITRFWPSKEQAGLWFFDPAYKKKAVYILAGCFIAMRLFCLFHYRGYFAFDEFYHLMDKNREGVMLYRRAPYINGMIALIKELFGSNFFAVKAVPFLLGCISFACFLYLICKLAEKPISIFAGGAVMILNPLLIYNHMYIRMYVFQEAIYMLMMVILYQFLQKNEQDTMARNTIWLGCFNILPLLYALSTHDSSRYLLLLLSISVSVLYMLRGFLKKIMLKVTEKRKVVAVLLAVMGIVFLFAVRNRITEFIGEASGDVNWTANYLSDKPVLLLYLVLHCLPLLLGVIGSGLIVIKRKMWKNGFLYLMCLFPVLGFITVFASFYVLRTFMPFLPGMILFGFYFWDHMLIKWKKEKLIFFIGAITIFLTYQDWNPIKFYRQPYIERESRMNNIEGAVDAVRKKVDKGAKLATMLSTDMQMDYFELKPERNLNRYTGYLNGDRDKLSDDEFASAVSRMQESEDNWVVLMDEGGIERMVGLGFYDSWLERYEFWEFDTFQMVFSLTGRSE